MTTFTGIYTGLVPNPLNMVVGETYIIEVHSAEIAPGVWKSAIFRPGEYPPPEGEKVNGIALESVEVLLAMFTEIVVGGSGLKKIIRPTPRNDPKNS